MEVEVEPGRGRWVIAVTLTLVLIGGCGARSAVPRSIPDAGTAPMTSVVLDTSDPVTARYGYTDVDAGPDQVASLTGSQKALVWLGGYSNATCAMNWSDDLVRQEFAEYGLAGSGRVAGYFLADEPNTDGNCPTASAHLRSRSELVRSLDPDKAHFTFADIDDPGQFSAFRDSVGVIGTDPYPCRVNSPCDWSQIPRYIAGLRSAHIAHYMGVLQLFSGDGWRWPTGAELRHMISQWQNSDWCGEITFAWSYENSQLADHPDLLDVLRQLNTRPQTPPHACQ